MHAHPRRPQLPPHAARRRSPRWRRIIPATLATGCSLLAVVSSVPAASATTIPMPDPGGFGGITSTPPAPSAPIRAVDAGGMTGWQIALIALGAAIAAATTAVIFDRILNHRSPARTAITTRPSRQAQPEHHPEALRASQPASDQDITLTPIASAPDRDDTVQFGADLP